MSRKVPEQKPGRSEQDVRTPSNFLEAVKAKLYISDFVADLAASPENTVAELFYTEADDALIQRWSFGGERWAWCNPPYADITPWVAKAHWEAKHAGAYVAMLVPASVGSNWWRDSVHNKAYTLFLNGRLTFVGHTSPYPKDLALLLYTPFLTGGYDIWDWN